jgi:hypothetical protein
VTELLVAAAGRFVVACDDGADHGEVVLDRADQGLLLPPGIWRELRDFALGSVCVVLASGEFEEADYVRDHDEFRASTARSRGQPS